jgi:hypothetical protein
MILTSFAVIIALFGLLEVLIFSIPLGCLLRFLLRRRISGIGVLFDALCSIVPVVTLAFILPAGSIPPGTTLGVPSWMLIVGLGVEPGKVCKSGALG